MILNTQQVILLCLLVSFVTSLATGISVVSLMQQNPEPVTQTINRVIERTVETVSDQQPVKDIKSFITQKPSSGTKDVITVVVNQEDQTINAVAKNENSIARVYSKSKNQEYVTMGIVLNRAGDILIDKRTLDRRYSYIATFGSKKYMVKYVSGSETANFIKLRIEGENPNDFVPAILGDSNSLKLAQSVISLSGSESTSVGVGEIGSLNKTTDGSLASISTSVNAQNVLNGSVILNLQGSVVGMKLYTTESKTIFIPINTIKTEIANLLSVS